MVGPVERSPSSEPEDGSEAIPLGPGGERLSRGRRMTCREARSWVKRSDAVLGRWQGGATIEWVSDHDRVALAASVRHGEGRDCNVAGDVLLFRLADGRPAVVVEEQHWAADAEL